MKIRLALVITKMELGGAQRHVLAVARGLSQETYDITLISGSDGELLEEAGQIAGIKIILIPAMVREISPLKDFSTYLQLKKLFLREKFDIVHTHSSKAGILGRYAAKATKTPAIIHTVHGFPFHPFQPLLLRRLYILLERSAAKATQTMIVVTPADQEKGVGEGVGMPHQYVTIRAGIDLSQFTPLQEVEKLRLKTSLGIPLDHLVVGTIAVLKPQKAPLDFVKMVKSFSQLNSAIPVTFLYVGTGELEKPFLEAIKEAGLEGSIKWLGRWSKPLNEFYDVLDLFILTSLWEGLPGVIIEAQVMGVPVLATGVDGSREFIQNGYTGWISPPAKPDLMAEKLLKIIHNRPALSAIAAQAKNGLAKDFAQSVMVNHLDQLYKRLLTPPK